MRSAGELTPFAYFAPHSDSLHHDVCPGGAGEAWAEIPHRITRCARPALRAATMFAQGHLRRRLHHSAHRDAQMLHCRHVRSRATQARQKGTRYPADVHCPAPISHRAVAGSGHALVIPTTVDCGRSTGQRFTVFLHVVSIISSFEGWLALPWQVVWKRCE